MISSWVSLLRLGLVPLFFRGLLRFFAFFVFVWVCVFCCLVFVVYLLFFHVSFLPFLLLCFTLSNFLFFIFQLFGFGVFALCWFSFRFLFSCDFISLFFLATIFYFSLYFSHFPSFYITKKSNHFLTFNSFDKKAKLTSLPLNNILFSFHYIFYSYLYFYLLIKSQKLTSIRHLPHAFLPLLPHFYNTKEKRNRDRRRKLSLSSHLASANSYFPLVY